MVRFEKHGELVNSLKLLWKISRPRFWLYLAGPYLLGYTAGLSTLQPLLQTEFWLYFLLFLIPANVILYGINDYFDRDTDAKNVKKTSKEHRLAMQDERTLLSAILLSCLLFGLAFYASSPVLRWLLLVFLALSWLYSTPPVRFKARPILDSLSNVLYIVPGVFGYYQTSGSFPSLLLFVGLWAWAAAMHLFSAIPDIIPDRQARVATGATLLGARGAMLLCTIYWLVFAVAVVVASRAWWSWISFAYPLIAIMHWKASAQKIDKMYWYFPYINACLGALGFFALALQRI